MATRHEEAVARLRERYERAEKERTEAERKHVNALNAFEVAKAQAWPLADAMQAERNARCAEPGCSLCVKPDTKEAPNAR